MTQGSQEEIPGSHKAGNKQRPPRPRAASRQVRMGTHPEGAALWPEEFGQVPKEGRHPLLQPASLLTPVSPPDGQCRASKAVRWWPVLSNGGGVRGSADAGVCFNAFSTRNPSLAYNFHYVISTFSFSNGNVNFNYFQGVLMALGINQYK